MCPPRSYPPAHASQSLNGVWNFKLHKTDPTPTSFAADSKVSVPAPEQAADARPMPVPGHWVLPPDTFGTPQYTNVNFPFPVLPPLPPDENPTADYWTTFTPTGSLSGDAAQTDEEHRVLPEDRGGTRQVRLRFDGVESMLHAWLNGTYLGFSTGSRLAVEFDISDLIKPGSNLLQVRVQQFSRGSYLEDQDQWWLPGIFRDVSVQYVDAIEDVWVNTDYSDGQGRIRLRVRTDANDATAHVNDTALAVSWRREGEWLDSNWVSVGSVQPWEADQPVLYPCSVTVGTQTRDLSVGFRRVNIDHGVLKANGHPLKLVGVNRHEVRSTAGRVFDESFARRDLQAMKALGINAIRTSHYPPHPRFLDLCDELGFWVMLECDVETHGFEGPDGSWRQNPSDDPQWRAAFLNRIERAFERDKNHPSIFCWSLGNESGTGQNLRAMSQWLRHRDPHCLIHYEGDYGLRYSDFYSRMYATVEEVEAALDISHGAPIAVPNHPAARITDTDVQRVHASPVLLCEYLHAMGTGPGGAIDYRKFFNRPRFAGGFVWEWRDHTLLADGKWCYGGDFDEAVHDGNFVCDGLVDLETIPDSGALNWANLYAPFTLEETDGRWQVRNNWCRRSLSELYIRWNTLPGTPQQTGKVPLPEVAVGQTVPLDFVQELDLPEGARLRVAIMDTRLPGLGTYAGPQVEPVAGYRPAPVGYCDSDGDRTVTFTQSSSRPSPVDTEPAATSPGGFSVDERGLLKRVGNVELPGLSLAVWRAPTDNDRGHGPSDYWGLREPGQLGGGLNQAGPSNADRWQAARLHQITRKFLELTKEDDAVVVREYWAPPATDFGAYAMVRYEPAQNGVRVTYRFNPVGPWPAAISRLGVYTWLPDTDWQVRWQGAGPGVNYPDLAHANWQGVFTAPVSQMVERHVRPQEAGNRGPFTWLKLTRSRGANAADTTAGGEAVASTSQNAGLAVRAQDMSFSVSPHSARTLDECTHWDQLPQSERTYLWIDAAQHGIGTRSCGPDTRPQYALRPVATEFSFTLSALSTVE